MQLLDGEIILSASDLTGFLAPKADGSFADSYKKGPDLTGFSGADTAECGHECVDLHTSLDDTTEATIRALIKKAVV